MRRSSAALLAVCMLLTACSAPSAAPSHSPTVEDSSSKNTSPSRAAGGTICLSKRDQLGAVVQRRSLGLPLRITATSAPNADGLFLSAPEMGTSGALSLRSVHSSEVIALKRASTTSSQFTGRVGKQYATFREYGGDDGPDANEAFAYSLSERSLIPLGAGTFFGNDAIVERDGRLVWLQDKDGVRRVMTWTRGDSAPHELARGGAGTARFVDSTRVMWLELGEESSNVHVVKADSGASETIPAGLKPPEPVRHIDIAEDGAVVMASMDGRSLYYTPDLNTSPRKVWVNDSDEGLAIDGVEISTSGFMFFVNGRGNRYVDRKTLVGIQVTPFGFSSLNDNRVLVQYPVGVPEDQIFRNDLDFRGATGSSIVFTFQPGRMPSCGPGATETPPPPPG